MEPRLFRPIRLLQSLIFLFFIISQLVTNVHAQVRKLYVENNGNELKKFSFYSPTEGYIAYRDWIGYTTDSGKHFSSLKSITLSNVDYNGYAANLTFGFGINGVKAFNQNTLIAYGDYGAVPAILYSSNAGANWKLIFLSQFDPMYLRGGITDMVFPQNNTVGFAIDADRILKTTDGGVTWQPAYTASASYFTNLEAVDNNTVFAICNYINTKLVKTMNGGASWSTVTLPAGRLNYAQFLTAAKGWVSITGTNGEGAFYTTNDGGSNWILQNDVNATPFVCNKMKFVDDITGYAIGYAFSIFKTIDGGKIWEELQRDNNYTYLNYTYNDLQVFNASQFWIGGGGGLFEISSNGGGTPVPGVFFKVDTTGYVASGTVKLSNYSRTDYTYEWFVNGVSAGTGYNATYTHDVNHLNDTIRLVASNGVTTAEATRYPAFFPPVIVSSFTPVTAAGGTVITITGKQFTGATKVLFGGEPAYTLSVQNDNTIKAMVGSGASGPVTVFTPRGTGTLPGFTYIPPPVITSFAPGSSKAGTTVTITGSEFTGVTAVTFGGIAATSYTVVSPTEITAITPSGGSGDVQVTALGGTTVKTGYIALPDITAFTPTSGTAGTILKITGTSLTGITSVTAGGLAVNSFTVNSSTSISAIVGAGSTGDIVISKPGGAATTGKFNWYPKPIITSFSPKSGPVGTTIVITGSNFDAVAANNTVLFGDVKATVLSGTASSLTVSVPAGTVYDRIGVISHLLTAYSRESFMITFPNGGAITAQSFDTLTALKITFDGNYGVASYKLTDFDRDGKTDVVVDQYGSYMGKRALAIYRNTSTTGTVSFEAPVRYIFDGPQDLNIGDIDGDGKPDLLLNNWDYYTFSVIRNTSTPGIISFGARTDFPAGFRPGAMVVGDIDMDGKPDVTITNYPDSVVSVFRNVSDSGYISFMPRVDFRAYGGKMIHVSDMDEDGWPDLVVSSGSSRVVSVLKNSSSPGTIAFAPAQKYQDYYPSGAQMGDIDNDGKMDVVITDYYSSKAVIYRNKSVSGNISLAAPVPFDAFSNPASVALGDMDGDGLLDIATASANHVLTLLKNTSSSGSISFAPKVDYDTGNVSERNVQLGDFNNDGRPDAAIASRDKMGITFYINRVKPEPFIQSFTPTTGEAGTSVTITGKNFTGATAVIFGGVPAASFTVNSATSITAVTGSGATGDLAVTNAYGTGVRAGFSVGLPPVITAFTPHSGPVGATITINGMRFGATINDNTVYIGGVPAVVTSASATSLTITAPANLNNSPITVTTNGLTAYADRPFVTTFPGADTAITAASFAARFDRALGGCRATSDLDGDGKQDLIVIGGNGLTIARNTSTQGSLSFAGNITFSAGSSTTTPAVGDIDGDGKPDVVVLYGTGASLAVYRNTSSSGNLSFETPKNVLIANGYSNNISGIVIYDVDGDGRAEIVLSDYSANTVSIFRSLSSPGNIAFATQVDFLVNGYANDLTFSDIDADGKTDILVAGNGGDKICVFRNLSTPGSIELAPRIDLDIASDWPENVKVIDMDGDGKPEIIAQSVYPKNLTIFRNTSTPGNISFQPKQQWSDAGLSYSLAAGDLDGDGKPDIVINNQSYKTNFIYKNKSTPGNIVLGTKLELALGDGAWWNDIADMDGDGQPEIITYVSPNITSIFRNLTGKAKPVTVCANGSTTITSNVTGNYYQWQQNTGSGFVNISDNTPFTGTTTAALKIAAVPAGWNGYQYRCIVDGTQNSIAYMININGTTVTPSVTIASDKNNICQGSVVTFTATTANEGSAPVYKWKLNNTDAGANSNTFIIDNLANGDQVQLLLTNSDVCASQGTVNSNVISMTVTPTVQAVVNITKTPDPVCSGMPVTFTASVTNGGTSPSYQWRKNGVITGTNSSTFVDNSSQAGDTVRVRVVSNAACAVRDTVFSNTIRINAVIPAVVTGVTISGNTTVDEGASTDLTAAVTGGGTNPVYQWQDSTQAHGWQLISGAATSVLTYTPAASNDKVRCIVTSNAPCASLQTVTSAPLNFTVQSGARATPNPVIDNLTITGLKLSDNWETLEIADMNSGNKIITKNIANQTSVTFWVGQLAPGQYVAILRSKTGDTKYIRFMKL